jgi:integrase
MLTPLSSRNTSVVASIEIISSSTFPFVIVYHFPLFYGIAVDRKEVQYLDDKQAQMFLDLLLEEKDIRVKTVFILLLFTGIRRGELCGLSW